MGMHKYISKIRTKSGKWRYIYKDADSNKGDKNPDYSALDSVRKLKSKKGSDYGDEVGRYYGMTSTGRKRMRDTYRNTRIQRVNEGRDRKSVAKTAVGGAQSGAQSIKDKRPKKNQRRSALDSYTNHRRYKNSKGNRSDFRDASNNVWEHYTLNKPSSYERKNTQRSVLDAYTGKRKRTDKNKKESAWGTQHYIPKKYRKK